MPARRYDIAIVGAGAAGLMAAIQAARTRPGLSIVALDGARSLGAKILVAGGGRCNVTHFEVSSADFNGSSRPAIAKVLRQLDVAATTAFFADLGVHLVQEPTGKLFPTTNRARTVLDALLAAARAGGVELANPCRVETISPADGTAAAGGSAAGGFAVAGSGWGELWAQRVVLATGGQALPKSGSDGVGYSLARTLGHTVTPLSAALVPLELGADHFLRGLSGVACPARLEVLAPSGQRLATATGPLLCTHFGISGPVVLDISRHLLAARRDEPRCRLVASFLPDLDLAGFEAHIVGLGHRSVVGWLSSQLPDRLAHALAAQAGIAADLAGARCSRPARRALATTCLTLELPVVRDRGYEKAEATAGGVPLSELHLTTMASRCCPGLHLCGEVLDVDGRLGGFNFQWAWASGTSAGKGAAALCQVEATQTTQ